MMKHLLSIMVAILTVPGLLFGQGSTGDIRGTVKDDNGEPVPFTNVVLLKDGIQFRGEATDFDGVYLFRAVPAGDYVLQVSAVGYSDVKKSVTVLSGGRVTYVDFQLTKGIIINEITFSDEKPMIQVDNTIDGVSFTRDQIMKAPTRGIGGVATLAPAVFSRDGEVGNIRGSRSGATYIIDGVKIRGGSVSLPREALQETQVILGGVPAEFGDATGGLILVTTRSVPNKFFGAVEGRTSQFLDRWGDALFSGVVGGPLARRVDRTSVNEVKIPVLGFLTSVEGNYAADPSPVRGGSWKVKDAVRDNLITNPIRLAETGSGTRLNAEYLRMSDFERIPTRQNVAYRSITAQAKIDYTPTFFTTVSAGGYVVFSDQVGGRDGTTYNNSLFNWENNGRSTSYTWNAWGRITHRFKEDSSSTLRNAMVSLQVDYLRGGGTVEDVNHGNRFFNYGHVGYFDVYRRPIYPVFGFDPHSNTSGWLFAGYQDTLITFTPGYLNPLSSAVTSQYYTFYDSPVGVYDEFPNIQNGGALLNGQSPRSVYGLWNNIGTQFNSYQQSQNNQFRVVGQGSVSIKGHNIRLGFEFEQRNDNYYSIAPVGLWRLAYLNANRHLGTIDTSKPELVYDANGIYQDTINYPYLYREDEARTQETGYKFGVGQSFFDWNMRQKLGLDVDGLDYVDVDKYDPSFFSLNMFSADELLNQGGNIVSYYGYDVYGNLTGGNVTFDDFFTAKDQYGNFTRPISSFQPIYMAGYISDKFMFNDIIFNIGVRVDRFDANQMVLRDRYSLYQTRTRGEVSSLGGNDVSHPGNIGNDFVVYVNDRENPTEIVGYRDGNTWYNASGQVINDPALLRTASGRVQPLMVNPSDDVQSQGFSPSGSFVDYSPQVNVMPRISFSFPISEYVGFNAYYDVLTQRPSGAVRLNPLDYFFWDNASYNSSGVFFNNPSLRPERTTDFSLGFRSALGEKKRSSLTISAYYRELRDMIAMVRVHEAFPRTYNTWDNIDFGTVKGVSFEYRMMPVPNTTLMASYTLQFADGTGSDNTSALNLVNSGQPNLRTTVPTNYDRRHLFTGFFIFNFGDKEAGTYIGSENLRWLLENFGFSATLRGGSGVPYSRQSNVTGTQISNGGQPSLLGSINGARLPWEFSVDLLVDKDINIKWKKSEGNDGKKPREANLNIYLQVLNVFDIANTISVYAATGNPDDDGYLTEPQFQPFINGQVDPLAFRDMYALKVNDPRNFSLPRRIRFGAILSF